ncbi:MAG: SH3 domain-containing protein [Alkalibacterium sp.]|nr:SH3 domain-containing protein [Alkalibacterium sp.]
MKNKDTVLKSLIGVLSILIVLGIGFLISRNFGTSDSLQEEEPPTEQPVPEEPVTPPPSLPIFYNEAFEMPVIGAAGYTSVEERLYSEPDDTSSVKASLASGTPFEIREERGAWWRIRTDENEGWIKHKAAFINLPDVVPSIVYYHTNSRESLFQSSYTDIPGVTGEAISNMIDHNERLDQTEYIFPILYQTAYKVSRAQQLAMLNGETLVVYETYRSQENSELVRESLVELIEENEEVEEGVTEAPWSIGWFIHSSISNHNRGAAIDLSLAQVNEVSEKIVGDYVVREVTDYIIYDMHTPFHELSVDSALFVEPISSMDRDGWRELDFHPDVVDASKRMVNYMVEAGFTPLASEWWHFNDLDALEALGPDAGVGDFDITRSINSRPSWEEVEEFLE